MTLPGGKHVFPGENALVDNVERLRKRERFTTPLRFTPNRPIRAHFSDCASFAALVVVALHRTEGVGPVGQDACAAGLDPHAAATGKSQQQLISEQERADLSAAGQLVIQRRLPGDRVAVVDDVLAVDVDRFNPPVAVEKQRTGSGHAQHENALIEKALQTAPFGVAIDVIA